jgi:hypothetical protein
MYGHDYYNKSNFMENIKKIFKSRTILVLVFLIIFNGVQAMTESFDPNTYAIVNSILVTIAGYFRINPQANFDK